MSPEAAADRAALIWMVPLGASLFVLLGFLIPGSRFPVNPGAGSEATQVFSATLRALAFGGMLVPAVAAILGAAAGSAAARVGGRRPGGVLWRAIAVGFVGFASSVLASLLNLFVGALSFNSGAVPAWLLIPALAALVGAIVGRTARTLGPLAPERPGVAGAVAYPLMAVTPLALLYVLAGDSFLRPTAALVLVGSPLLLGWRLLRGRLRPATDNLATAF